MRDLFEESKRDVSGVISTGYEPRSLQGEIHLRIARFSVLAIHRRFGKTVLAINHGIDVGLECKLHNPRVSFISPLYKQSKTVAWEYLKEFTRNIPGSKSYESELRVDIPMGELNGKKNTMRFQLFGADNPDSLRGMYHDYAIFDEYGNQPKSIWSEVVSPALADRQGGALFLGTPNGKNHFYDLYQEAKKRYEGGDNEWFAATYRADETNILPPKELQQQRDNMPEEEYRQEFLCDWAAAIRGAFYASEVGKVKDQGRCMRLPFERGLPVYVAFDLGIDDMSALWFVQCFRAEIRVIRYEEFKNIGLVDIIEQIATYGYVYAHFIMPWDVKIRELTSGKTRLEAVESLGYEVEVAPKISIEDGINAVRMLLSQCYFDAVACERGIDCLENYRKKYDQRTGTFLKTPEHDEFSHGADAFRYLAVSYDPCMGQGVLSRGGDISRHKPKVVRSS